MVSFAILSLSSSITLCAIFLPIPGANVSAFSSPATIAKAMDSGVPAERIDRRSLWSNAGHSNKHFKAALFAHRIETVNIKGVFPNVRVSIHASILANF